MNLVFRHLWVTQSVDGLLILYESEYFNAKALSVAVRILITQSSILYHTAGVLCSAICTDYSTVVSYVQ